MPDSHETVIQLSHITKEFPGVLANDDVSLEIYRGEVFALVGENGAGKSTLMNIIYGIYPPTDGEVLLRGEKLNEFSPKNTIAHGIGMVHQHFMLVPSFTVAQNIVLSREPRKAGIFFDNKKAEEITRSLIKEYGLMVDPQAKVEDISVGVQQRVEILKALYRGADILILDEPTAVLTPQETDELFMVIRHIIKEKNMTVILITHKLREVMAISDRVGIMRRGKLVKVTNTKDITEQEIASKMVGRPVLFDELPRKDTQGEVMISVKDLYVKDNRGLTAVKDVSFDLLAGEVLGIAAIDGNGQSELLEAITGLRSSYSGSIKLKDTEILGMTPGKIRALGLSHVPDDRLATGVDAKADVCDNLITGRQHSKNLRGFAGHLLGTEIDRTAGEIYERFDIRGAGLHGTVGAMSGGNMQKVVVAREFSYNTPVLIISNPSRGIDIGATEFIHEAIMEKRNSGCAILLSSADLDEIFRLSDNIITMFEGEITGYFKASEISKEEIGFYMTGSRGKEAVRSDAV